MKYLFCVLVSCVGVVFGDVGTARDTYLDAYAESHGTTPSVPVKSDREYTEPFPQYPQPQYPPPQPQYPPPQPQYPPPQPQYGPPNKYFAPSASAPNYGPPPAPIYGVPPIIVQQPIYGTPHKIGLDLWEKFKFKLDLFTLGKILLKLVLFKKFISFVAILCLLLFIPHLKHKVEEAVPEDEDPDNGRSLKEYNTNFVLNSIEKFSKKYEKTKDV